MSSALLLASALLVAWLIFSRCFSAAAGFADEGSAPIVVATVAVRLSDPHTSMHRLPEVESSLCVGNIQNEMTAGEEEGGKSFTPGWGAVAPLQKVVVDRECGTCAAFTI